MSGEARRAVETACPSLAESGLEEVEVYLKKGRVRRYELDESSSCSLRHDERGWAVRASGRRSSLFVAGTGDLSLEGPWPEPDGFPIQLPYPVAPTDWKPPADLEAPLMVESEARELLEVCKRELGKELPSARLLRAVLEDGRSDVEIANSRGVEASHKGRVATLFLEALDPDAGRGSIVELYSEREAKRFHPRMLVRRLADRLVLHREGRRVERDRADVLLGPVVGARILAGLRPLLVGPEGAARARALDGGRSARFAAPTVTIVDDGSLADGLLTAPVDGEGVPTRPLVLVEEGVYKQPLRTWFQEDSGKAPASAAGCLRRAGWRDLPRLGASHLFIQADPAVRVATLLADLARGYYLTDVLGPPVLDLENNHFRLPACGFEVRSGRPVQRVSRAVLSGKVTSLLEGVRAVARDLTFFPLGALVGSPSLLVSGLELVEG